MKTSRKEKIGMSKMSIEEVHKQLKKRSSKKKARILEGFFKTGPCQYAEGDIIIKIKVPRRREITKK